MHMMLCASRQCKSCQRYGMYCKAQCPKNTNIVPISLNPLENIEELSMYVEILLGTNF